MTSLPPPAPAATPSWYDPGAPKSVEAMESSHKQTPAQICNPTTVGPTHPIPSACCAEASKMSIQDYRRPYNQGCCGGLYWVSFGAPPHIHKKPLRTSQLC